jgi:hypothetical protein
LIIEENLNDGRYHEEVEGKDTRDNELIPGCSLLVDIKNIKRTFYSRSGTLLNIHDAKTPVLVLKTNAHTVLPAPSRSGEKSEKDEKNVNGVDWFAIEVYGPEKEDSDSEESEDELGEEFNSPESLDEGNTVSESLNKPKRKLDSATDISQLSLIEYLLRVCNIEYIEQTSHLNVCDEKLSLYFSDDQSNSPTLPAAPHVIQSKALARTPSNPQTPTPIRSSSGVSALTPIARRLDLMRISTPSDSSSKTEK